MQLCSYLTREVVLTRGPGGSRTLDMVRSVSLLNAFLFFPPTRSSKWEQHPAPRAERRTCIRFYSIVVFCCSCVPASVVVLAAG